jgi:predicted GIY-YIG superfamily endonuclease
MINEKCPWKTHVYGLIYPGRGLFYVGITVSTYERFSTHWSATGECSSYDVIRLWKRTGQKFDHLIFGTYDDRIEALRLERALVHHLSGLVNKKGASLLSPYMYPVTDEDEVLLIDALERVGMRAPDANIDRSGEYVDERYDDDLCDY